jgi:hypothetical protein
MWQLLGVEQIQNGGRCHGNQGTKWPPNTKIFQFGRFGFQVDYDVAN